MAKVTIKMYTVLKDHVGCGKVEIEGGNVSEVLEKMKAKFGERFLKTLYEPDGSIKGYYILLLNGKVVDLKNTQKYKMKNGDTMHIFPPIAGG